MTEVLTPDQAAAGILECCLRHEPPPSDAVGYLLNEASSEDEERARVATKALFTGLVEPLCDRFDRELVEAYVELFSWACAPVVGVRRSDLVCRYERVRRPKPFAGAPPERVFVLSRITVGADVAVTSVLMDAAHKRFPGSQVVFVGPAKNYELFEGAGWVRHAPFSYGRRSALPERLAVFNPLRHMMGTEDAIVIDPDSRLTQLGLLPVCPEDRYYFFESRAYGGAGTEPLSTLASRWAAEIFDVEDAQAFVAPKPVPAPGERPLITVSLGVGENPARRVNDPFEGRLLSAMGELGGVVVVDKGPGGEEAERVERALAGVVDKPQVQAHEGSFASFASLICQSSLYVGYDSSGQHVAAAAAIPEVTVCAGHLSDRMSQRWRPSGKGSSAVFRVEPPVTVDALVEDVMTAARGLLRGKQT
ncbi:MAG: hypothetical protein SFV54_27640 [Bryobacteraceae bacterium]|nr:hypothetical protein [Bryobacteraceae bacterium]